MLFVRRESYWLFYPEHEYYMIRCVLKFNHSHIYLTTIAPEIYKKIEEENRFFVPISYNFILMKHC